MFWGLLLEEGKFYSQKVTKPFHVSMAALEPSGKGGHPVTVNLEQDGMDFILCTLREDSLYQQAVDLNFAQNDEIKFFLSGKGTVHLTGYVVSEEDSDFDDEDSDEEPPQLTAMTKKPKEAEKVSNKKPVKEAAKDESDDSEDESDDDSDDSDEEMESPLKKKPVVPDKKVEKKPVPAKKAEPEDDSDEEDSDDSEDGVIDFKKLMEAASSGDDDDDDDDDIDMDEMDEDEDEEGEEEEDSEDDSSEEEAPPKKSKKTPNTDGSKLKKDKKTPVKETLKKEEDSEEDSSEEESPPKKSKKTPPTTPNTDGAKLKKDKKTPVKEKAKPTPEPVKSGKKRKEIDESPLVNGVDHSSKKSKKNKHDKLETPQESPKVKTPKRCIKGGIVVEDLKVGNGPESVSGKYVSVHYTGKLKSNNQEFDSNTSGKGFKFRLGGNEVIKGWDLGVAGMKVGGKRRLTIPYKMAYGEKGSAPEIPPKADLIFDVELKNVH